MADWIPNAEFEQTEYGRLNRALPSSAPFYMEVTAGLVPPGGSIVPDPKDGVYGIIKHADGTPIAKVCLKPQREG